ncbi:hypothetical protein [Agaribacterium haliotis]|uniref:DUF748 domain-containing protein n=1 Tax=Agaribacterium haliotis TaxID=2013869 RepID=UPI000BB596A6|nr:hypothetical protein [Agaribacterium haliotis]
MKKFGKIILSLLAILVLVIAVALWYVFSNLNEIVKEIVEKEGSAVLQTPVSLNHVDIKLMDARATLGQFSIKNYPGFSEKNLAGFDDITVAMDPATLEGKVIVLDEIVIDGVNVVAEQKGKSTNIQTLLDKLPKSDSADSETSADSSTSEEPLLAINKLRFTNNSLKFVTEKWGSKTLKMPDIVQNNIGSASHGLTPKQVTEAIIKPLLEQAKKSVKDAAEQMAREHLEDQYGEQIDDAKKQLKDKQDELQADADAKQAELEAQAKDKQKDMEDQAKDKLKKLF